MSSLHTLIAKQSANLRQSEKTAASCVRGPTFDAPLRPHKAKRGTAAPNINGIPENQIV